MTRDDHRAQCIEAMAAGMYGKGWDGPAEKMPGEKMKDVWRNYARRAFDSLRTAGARVNPVKATEEMLTAARNYFSDPLTAYETIAAAGDLTNQPEQKP
jgi:hypothetical protein